MAIKGEEESRVPSSTRELAVARLPAQAPCHSQPLPTKASGSVVPWKWDQHLIINVHVTFYFLKPFPQSKVGLGMHSVDVWVWEKSSNH